MKAKKKPLAKMTAADLGVDITPTLLTTNVEEVYSFNKAC
jgi:electron transfer flavoprotein alpha/beta subunit